MFQRQQIPEADVYHLLSNARRRTALTVLWERANEMTLRELSEEIASAETGVRPAPRAVRESVYNTLHQTHMPKLASFGLVEYEPDRKVVRTRKGSRQLSQYMDTVTVAGVTWGEYYRTLGIGGLFAVVASLAEIPGFALVDPLVFASVVLGLFACSTLYQLATAPATALAGIRRSLANVIGRRQR